LRALIAFYLALTRFIALLWNVGSAWEVMVRKGLYMRPKDNASRQFKNLMQQTHSHIILLVFLAFAIYMVCLIKHKFLKIVLYDLGEIAKYLFYLKLYI
jgi:hypothetical protein